MPDRVKRPRPTPEDWREIEARYHDLCRAERALFDALSDRCPCRVLDRVARIRASRQKAGTVLEGEAVRQLGSDAAPWFNAAPRDAA